MNADEESDTECKQLIRAPQFPELDVDARPGDPYTAEQCGMSLFSENSALKKPTYS